MLLAIPVDPVVPAQCYRKLKMAGDSGMGHYVDAIYLFFFASQELAENFRFHRVGGACRIWVSPPDRVGSRNPTYFFAENFRGRRFGGDVFPRFVHSV